MSERELPPPGDDPQIPEYVDEAEEATRAEHDRSEEGAVVSIADLVGAKVETSQGEKRGTVTDVLIAPPPDLRIIGLVVGATGWIHRLRVVPVVRRATGQASRLDEIPWEAVDRWDGLRIILHPEASEEGVSEET